MNLDKRKKVGLYVFDDSECRVQYRMCDSHGPVSKYSIDDLALEFVKRNGSDKDFRFVNGMYKFCGKEHYLSIGEDKNARVFTRNEMISFYVNLSDIIINSKRN